MQITSITIRPANEELVKAYASICFDDCFVVHDIWVIEAPTGLFILFPTKKLSDGSDWDVAFPASTETRRMIERGYWRSTRRSLPETAHRQTLAQNSKRPNRNER